jgi:hypothetical protein
MIFIQLLRMSAYDELGEKWRQTFTTLDWRDCENHKNRLSGMTG